MSKHKYIDRICCVILIFTLLISILFINAKSLGINISNNNLGYESRIFNTSKVHTIDIIMNDWEDFISSCTDEKYKSCSVVIDNEAFENVALRAKGNTSLSQVSSYNNNRYSFKIEFDHYDNTSTYYGLDKLTLNNIIQDNTYMKDYLCYRMMNAAGVNSPLCSYVQVLVNGEEWGLYLAVESIEESFLQRNYGSDYGNLYKPESMNMNGGNKNENVQKNQDEMPKNADFKNQAENENMPQMPQNGNGNNMPDGNMRAKGSSDVSLIYTDDEYDSYSNIFDNAKTDIGKSDKKRLISSLKQLNENENIENVVAVDSVIRYFVAHNFVCNFDSYTGSMIHNYYLYEKDGQISMLPWDYNLAFGGFGGGNAQSMVNYPIDTPVSGGTLDSRPMAAWIFNNDKYTQLYHQYFAQFIKDYFTSGVFAEEINSVKSLIAPYVESDPTKFCTYEEFETGVETLENFCKLRVQSIEKQLSGEIPSTSDGQSKDSSSLIQTANLNISDMGSMGGEGMGGNPPSGAAPNAQGAVPPDMPNGNMPQSPNDNTSQTDSAKEDDSQTSDKNNTSSEVNSGNPQESNGNNMFGENLDQQRGQIDNNRPENMPSNSETQSEKDLSSNAILTGICAFVLLGGLLFALFYKRK